MCTSFVPRTTKTIGAAYTEARPQAAGDAFALDMIAKRVTQAEGLRSGALIDEEEDMLASLAPLR